MWPLASHWWKLFLFLSANNPVTQPNKKLLHSLTSPLQHTYHNRGIHICAHPNLHPQEFTHLSLLLHFISKLIALQPLICFLSNPLLPLVPSPLAIIKMYQIIPRDMHCYTFWQLSSKAALGLAAKERRLLTTVLVSQNSITQSERFSLCKKEYQYLCVRACVCDNLSLWKQFCFSARAFVFRSKDHLQLL